MRYAENTTVSVEKSRAEIEGTLLRYGASHFAYMLGPDKAVIGFRAKGRMLRFDVPLPDRTAKSITRDKRGSVRSPSAQQLAFDQHCRQRWRALALCIKAKLEAVECNISSFENEFLAHIVLPGTGETVGAWIGPQLERAYETGGMPPLLLAGPESKQ